MSTLEQLLMAEYRRWSEVQDVHRITTLVEFIPDEVDWASWDPSITVTAGSDDRDRDAVRLMNNLCDALARNGFWWDRHGRVHKA